MVDESGIEVKIAQFKADAKIIEKCIRKGATVELGDFIHNLAILYDTDGTDVNHPFEIAYAIKAAVGAVERDDVEPYEKIIEEPRKGGVFKVQKPYRVTIPNQLAKTATNRQGKDDIKFYVHSGKVAVPDDVVSYVALYDNQLLDRDNPMKGIDHKNRVSVPKRIARGVFQAGDEVVFAGMYDHIAVFNSSTFNLHKRGIEQQYRAIHAVSRAL